MYDKALTVEVLSQILTATARIARRFEAIKSPDDFLNSDYNQMITAD